MEFVSKLIVASLYDGTNPDDVLAAAQTLTPSSGNTYSVVSSDAYGMFLREAWSATFYYDWFIPTGYWLVVEPGFGIRDRMTDAAFKSVYKLQRELFLAAARDPAVLAELAEALEIPPPSTVTGR